MSDSTTFSDTDFSPVDGSTPAPTSTNSLTPSYGNMQATPEQMNAWNQQATIMANIGGPGANQKAAQQWLQQQYSGASTPTSYNDSDFSPLPTPVKTVGGQGTPDTTQIGRASCRARV